MGEVYDGDGPAQAGRRIMKAHFTYGRLFVKSACGLATSPLVLGAEEAQAFRWQLSGELASKQVLRFTGAVKRGFFLGAAT